MQAFKTIKTLALIPALLLTGDGDFERPVEVLRARGKRVVVACIAEMTSVSR